MRRRGRGSNYECALCGVFLVVMTTQRVRTMLILESGRPTERAILVNGKEVHRCTLHGPVAAPTP